VILVVTGVPALPDPGVVSTVALVILTFGISAAILRYRLYDLDRIISRALSYGLLTVLLGGGYAGLVLGLGGLVGRRSNLVVALATLAVAAIFQPARRRIQRAVDRRFNRRRYDAARTIQSFSARLRQELDLDALTVEALAVVDQTMQPTQASLWLRPHPGRPGSELVESSPPVPAERGAASDHRAAHPDQWHDDLRRGGPAAPGERRAGRTGRPAGLP
jgi:hypothetical protein